MKKLNTQWNKEEYNIEGAMKFTHGNNKTRLFLVSSMSFVLFVLICDIKFQWSVRS